MRHTDVALRAFVTHPSDRRFRLRLHGMQQRRDDLMMETLYGRQMDGFHRDHAPTLRTPLSAGL
ncbi:MAG: hypothetical protein MZV64_59095 [Ignavibacteriales bacterium]|nr:hypothetical protein [Ignavibacteriales bacterium]